MSEKELIIIDEESKEMTKEEELLLKQLTRKETNVIKYQILQITEQMSNLEKSLGQLRSMTGLEHFRTQREELNASVRKYAYDNNVPVNVMWSNLYKELGGILHQNIKTRAKNKNVSQLDYVEAEGYLEDALRIVATWFA